MSFFEDFEEATDEVDEVDEPVAGSVATSDRVILTDTDGYQYDEATGEVVGRIGDDSADRVETAEQVESALETRAKIEAELAALGIRKRAMLANFQALERRLGSRLAWWDWRFRPDVIAFARKSLEGTKSKTAQFEGGAIKFRTAQGTNKITDQVLAVAFVEAVRPGAVKVKVERSVSVKDVREVAAQTGETGARIGHFLHSTGPREVVVIETGVGG